MPKIHTPNVNTLERCKRMPPSPRIVINGVVLVPIVDDDWQPIQDKWALPGRGVLTTQELRDLADARGLAFDLIT